MEIGHQDGGGGEHRDQPPPDQGLAHPHEGPELDGAEQELNPWTWIYASPMWPLGLEPNHVI